MPRRTTPETAEILGLKALGWLAGDPGSLNRFLLSAGTDAAVLRRAAEEPAMLGAVLEFLLANEDLLLRFCEDSSTASVDVHRARQLLEGPCG
jgi:hypothetical protein